MIAIEVWMNHEKVCTAGLADGLITAKLTVRNQDDPIWFDAVGRDRQTGSHVNWSHISSRVGDEFTLKLVDIESA